MQWISFALLYHLTPFALLRLVLDIGFWFWVIIGLRIDYATFQLILLIHSLPLFVLVLYL